MEPRRCDRNTSELPQCGQDRLESSFISNAPNLGYKNHQRPSLDAQFMAVRGSRVTRVFPSGVTLSEQV
jgi:hypothetical protein